MPGRGGEAKGERYSFDMLGEAALTKGDTECYFEAYHAAIEAVGDTVDDATGVFEAPSISVKLSALHPRFEFAKSARLRDELAPRLGAFDLGEDAVFEPFAEAVERVLDALYIAEIGTEADDHTRASSIRSRIRRTAASSPTKTASPTR